MMHRQNNFRYSTGTLTGQAAATAQFGPMEEVIFAVDVNLYTPVVYLHRHSTDICVN